MIQNIYLIWHYIPRIGHIFLYIILLTMCANYAIYEGIDKSPQICRHMGSMWSKVGLSGGIWRAVQLHIYLITYNMIRIDG